jgi:hypothetical protein
MINKRRKILKVVFYVNQGQGTMHISLNLKGILVFTLYIKKSPPTPENKAN